MKRRVKKNFLKVFSAVLSVSMIITSMPIAMGVSAAEDDSVVIPTKESEGSRYSPEFSYDRDYYDAIIDGVKDVKTIGKLPSYEEFVEKTGYKSTSGISLSKFREVYGVGSDFSVPEENVIILITSSDELDLLASLVNGTNDTTDTERVYYSKAYYKMVRNIESSNNRFIPIGTKVSSFNGTFDGNGFEISGITISGDSVDTYQSVEHFGLFGYIGDNGTVKNLGITECNINLPYVVGADVGIIAGRNYGTVDSCYITSKLNTKVTVSNSTVGGIAENYGVVKNMYADFYAKVAISDVSYSDPQPVVTVNNGTVENCYYIKWQNKNPVDTYTVEDDNGTNKFLVGWASENYAGFNGVGVSDEDLANLNNVNLPNFTGGTVTEYDEVISGREYNINDFRDAVGRGSSFDKSKADAILGSDYGNKLSVMSNEWSQFCDLVNGAPGVTKEEQEYFSTVEIYLGGSPERKGNFGYIIPRNYNYISIAGYDDNYTLGTEEHPFNGTLNGNNCRILSSDCEKPIFGVIGESAKIKDVQLSGSLYLDIDDLNSFNGITSFCDTNNGLLENCTMDYGIYYAVYGKTNVINYDEFDSFLSSNDLFFIKNNNGVIKDCSAVGYCKWYEFNDGQETSKKEGYFNIVSVNTGTVDDLKVGGDILNFNNIGTKDDSIKHDSLVQDGLSKPFTFVSKTFKVRLISKYPSVDTVSKPMTNSNGDYLIYTPEDLNYFIKNGNGENLILMNTIDMGNYIYGGKDTGYFNIDGKLTNESDISSYIDLGTGTKCYSILNLNIEGALSKSFGEGKGSWSNIYFIGGSVNIDVNEESSFYAELIEEKTSYDIKYYTDLYTFLLGDSIFNVHYNFDINYKESFPYGTDILSNNKLNDPNGNKADIREKYICISKNADLSSSGGSISEGPNSYNDFDLVMLGKDSQRCDSYANVINGDDVYCIGINVSYSKTHAKGSTNYRSSTVDRSEDRYTGEYIYYYRPAHMVYSVRGMGKNVSNSVYDDNLDSSHALKYIFGDNVTNSVFRGNIDTKYPIFKDNLSGFVFDEEGIISGAFEGMSGENILFLGNMKANSVIKDKVAYDSGSFVYNGTKVFNNAKNAINCGKIIVDATYFSNVDTSSLSKSTVDIYGMGTDTDGYMNGTIELIGDSNDTLNVNLIYYGSGSGANYSNIDYHDMSVKVKNVSVFKDNLSACENYGSIDVSDGVESLRVADGVNNFINYGDINTSGVSHLYVIIPNTTKYTLGRNYGNVKMDVTNNYSTFSVISDIVKSENNYPYYKYYYPILNDNTYNTGTIEVYSSNGSSIGYNTKYSDLGYVDIYNIDTNKSNSMFICFSVNYGEVSIHDINIVNTVLYLSERSYYGVANFNNVTFGNSSIVGKKEGYRVESDLTHHSYNISWDNISGVNNKQYYPEVSLKSCSGIVRLSSSKVCLENNNLSKCKLSEIPFIDGEYEDVDLGGNNKIGEFRIYYSKGSILAHDLEAGLLSILPYDDNSDSSIFVYDSTISTLSISGCGLSDVSVKDSSIESSTINTFAETLSEDDKSKISNVINYGNVNISNVDNVNYININQDEKTNSSYSYVNTGSIKLSDISTNTRDTFNAVLKVSGVCGDFDNNQKDTGVLNTGNIDVEFNGDIYVSGIGGVDGNKLYNCINIGDIKVSESRETKGIVPTFKVGGISCNMIKEAMGIINWGDIEVIGANLNSYKNTLITASVDVYEKLSNCINYGNVNVSDDGSEFANDFISVGVYTSSNYAPYNSMRTDTKLEVVRATCDIYNVLNYGDVNVILSKIPNVSYDYHLGATLYDYLDFEKSIINVNSSCNENLLMNRVDAKELSEPNAIYRFWNLTEEKYIKTTKKVQYNGGNNFEYADKDELRGELASFIDDNYPDIKGTYALTKTAYTELGESFEAAGTSGGNLEDSLNIDSNREIHTKWGKTTLPELVSVNLKQRDENTWVEFGWKDTVSDYPFISSLDKYLRKTGTTEIISEKSTLISRQEPVSIKVKDSSEIEYPENTIVTEMSLYMPLDDFDLSNTSYIKFKVNGYKMNGDKIIQDSDGEPLIITDKSTFKVFKNPIVIPNMYNGISREDFDSDLEYDDAVTKRLRENISNLFADETDNLLDSKFSLDKSFELPVSEDMLTESFSIILGIAVSEDGRRTNLLVINVIPKSILPSGSMLEVSYPTDISSDAKSLKVSTFSSDSDSSLTYKSDTVDDMNWRYPVYNMNEKMYHYTDGAYIDMYDNYYTGGVLRKEKGNSIGSQINNTVSFSFSSKNIKDYSIYVDDTLYTDDTIKERGNLTVSDFSISDDGATVNVNNVSVNINSSLLTSGGKHTIKVYGVPYYGDEDSKCTIFQIVINREKSPENYIKSKYFDRTDILHKDSSSSKVVPTLIGYNSINPINSLGFTDPRYTSDPTYSTLSKVNESYRYHTYYYGRVYGRNTFVWDTVDFSDYIKPKGIDTYYPTKMIQKVDIKAENGDIATYSITKNIANKLDRIPINSISSKNSGQSAGMTYIMPQDELVVNFIADYSNQYVNYNGVKIKYIKVYDGNGNLVDTVYPKDYSTMWAGIYFNLGTNGRLNVYTGINTTIGTNGYLDTDVFVDDCYTFVPVMSLGDVTSDEDDLPDNMVTESYYIEMEPFVISRSKLSVFRAVSVNWDNTLVTSAISTSENELSNNVDIYGNGIIDYTDTPDDVNTFYIENCVETNCSGDTIKIDVPITASLQEKIDGNWVTVFESSSDNHVFKKYFSYSASDLLVGKKYDFRIIAQDYDESDEVKKNHVAYYNTKITATLRNKDITIEFDDGDETMSLYKEILGNNGNTAIQIKNMNGSNAVLQQTKLYTGTSKSDMQSKFYKLSQGDYVIDVQIPSGYKAKVKIVGGSSEGYLIPSSVVKGDRIRLPYANKQSIKLVVYLERDTTSTDWGVTYNKSLYKSERVNKI